MCLPRCALSAFSEEEKICFFKVFPCGREYNHDFAACFYSHPGEKAKRRCLLEHMYGGKLCPDLKQNGECPRGDACHMTHSMFEYYMHPLRYRTKMCKDGTSCNRPFCFFAHQPSELRQPVEAGTFLASLSPQALASTAERLISGSSSGSGRSGAGSSSSTEAPNSPSRVQVVYHAPLPAALQQQQQQVPLATAAGMMSNPLLPFTPSGICANYGSSSSTTRLLNSPSSVMSSSSSNVDNVLLLHPGGVPVSNVGSGDLPSPIANSLHQSPVATVAPEVLLSPPRPMMPDVSSSGLMMAAAGGLYPLSQQQQQQWQQQAFAEQSAMLAGMMNQLALTEAAAVTPAAPQSLAVSPAPGSAAAVAALSAAAVRRSLDEAILQKQQQQQLLSKACLMSRDISSMLHRHHPQHFDQQRLAVDDGAANLATTAAGVTCLAPAALDLSVPVTGPVGGGGGH